MREIWFQWWKEWEFSKTNTKITVRTRTFLQPYLWFINTLLCGIIVLHILLIFDFFPCLHALLGTARLLILLKNSYLHVYLELKIHCFRGKFVNFTWYMTTIRPINMSNSLLHTITSIFDLLMAHKWAKSQYFWKFSYLHVY